MRLKENYTDEQVEKLEKICGRVAVLPRQAKTSTSDKIRQITIASRMKKVEGVEEKVAKVRGWYEEAHSLFERNAGTGSWFVKRITEVDGRCLPDSSGVFLAWAVGLCNKPN